MSMDVGSHSFIPVTSPTRHGIRSWRLRRGNRKTPFGDKSGGLHWLGTLPFQIRALQFGRMDSMNILNVLAQAFFPSCLHLPVLISACCYIFKVLTLNMRSLIFRSDLANKLHNQTAETHQRDLAQIGSAANERSHSTTPKLLPRDHGLARPRMQGFVARGSFNLGFMYQFGLGVSQDASAAPHLGHLSAPPSRERDRSSDRYHRGIKRTVTARQHSCSSPDVRCALADAVASHRRSPHAALMGLNGDEVELVGGVQQK